MQRKVGGGGWRSSQPVVAMSRCLMHAFDRADILDACLPDSDALARTSSIPTSPTFGAKVEDLGACGFFTAVCGVGYRFVEPR